jgi:hypothetical protein
MIVFLTSIRNPLNTNDYSRVERLFDISVQSVCSQTSADFRVVVVCNQRPQVSCQDPRIHYHVVDFPPPSLDRKSATGMHAVCRDKGTKLISGCLYARRFDPDYIMLFDADDLVSARVAQFLNAHRGGDGWYVNAGFNLSMTTMRIRRKAGLIRYCGSSVVFNPRVLYALTSAEQGLSENSTQEQILALLPANIVNWVFGDHKHVRRFFADRGHPLQPLPFAASVWVLQTGENHSDTDGADGQQPCGLPVSLRFRREFGLAKNDGTPELTATLADRVCELLAYWRSRLGFWRERMGKQPEFPEQ